MTLTKTNPDQQQQNVGSTERLVSVGSGGLLVLKGLHHRGLLGAAMVGVGAAMMRRGVSGHCSMYEKLGIDHEHTQDPPEPSAYYERGIHVTKSFTINKPAQDLYNYWRNFENFPGFMAHVSEVKKLDEKRSHWKATGPAGMNIEWDAEIINDEPGKLIAWQSLEGADVHSKGSVRFIETPDRGTQVKVTLDYLPPAGRLAAAFAYLFGEEPRQQIQEDLRHFKQLMESGEIPTNKSPRGTCKATSQE
jgi:uncharacterized membrane protein